MAHFAHLNKDNVVLKVIVINNEVLNNLPFPESEPKGIAFCRSLFGYDRWLQTSYNGSFRKNFAGVGYTYDSFYDVFIPPKPYFSWVLDKESLEWKAPITKPTDYVATWNEDTRNWVELISKTDKVNQKVTGQEA